MASIVVLNGASRGNYLTLGPRTVTIGRDERCDMQVLDEHVSRHHLDVIPEEDGVHYGVKDVGMNGARVNGKEVTGTAPLRDRCVIHIGKTELMFADREFDDTQGALTFAAHGQRFKQTVDPHR